MITVYIDLQGVAGLLVPVRPSYEFSSSSTLLRVTNADDLYIPARQVGDRDSDSDVVYVIPAASLRIS